MSKVVDVNFTQDDDNWLRKIVRQRENDEKLKKKAHLRLLQAARRLAQKNPTFRQKLAREMKQG